MSDVREQALSAQGHPAWEVLDRERCEALLTAGPPPRSTR